MKMFIPCRCVEVCAFARYIILSLSFCDLLVKVVDLPLQNVSEYSMNQLLFRGSIRNSKNFEINGSVLFRPGIQTEAGIAQLV
jgi:hypothetical protein